MLKIIDKYLLKECALATLGVIAVLLLIMLGNTFVRILGDVAENKLSSDALWPMLVISSIHYLVILLPIGLYLGILFGMGRLYKDSEMAAMSACGIGTAQLYRPVVALAVPLACVTAVLSLYLAPWAASQQDKIKHRSESRSELSGLVAGQFNESGNGSQTIFFERLSSDGRQMREVFAHSETKQEISVQVASSAVRIQKEGEDPYVLFQRGTTYTGNPGRLDYRVADFDSYGVRIEQGPLPALQSRISSKSTLALLRADDLKSVAEWHWRLAIPTVCLLLALLALPLSYTTPRKGRYAKLGIGIVIYIVYSNILSLGRAWLERDQIPSWLGLWWVHGLLLVGLAGLIMQHERIGLFAPRSRVST